MKVDLKSKFKADCIYAWRGKSTPTPTPTPLRKGKTGRKKKEERERVGGGGGGGVVLSLRGHRQVITSRHRTEHCSSFTSIDSDCSMSTSALWRLVFERWNICRRSTLQSRLAFRSIGGQTRPRKRLVWVERKQKMKVMGKGIKGAVGSVEGLRRMVGFAYQVELSVCSITR